MIKVICPSCHKTFAVPDNYEGKHVKCKNCSSIFTVPKLEIADIQEEEKQPSKKCPFCGEDILFVAIKCKHCGEALPKNTVGTRKFVPIGKALVNIKGKILSETRRNALTKIMPMWVWYTTFCWILVMFFGLIGYLGFRDIWERDNYEKIKQLSEQALNMSYAKNYEECFKTYDELFKLVENHELKYAKDLVAEARASYQQAKIDNAEYEKQQKIKMETKQRQEELALCSQLQYQLNNVKQAIQTTKYNDAMEQCNIILKRVEGREVKTNEMKSFLDSVRAQRELVNKEASRREQFVKEYACKILDRDIEFDKVNEIEECLYELSGDGQKGNRFVKESVYKWGADADSIKARQMYLEERGFSSIPNSGGLYGKITYEATHYVCYVRYRYENSTLKCQLVKCEGNGKPIVFKED